MASPRSLIVNSPYDPPTRPWQQARDATLTLVDGRRPAGYEIFDIRSNTRRTEPLELVNAIRERVDAWRAGDYPGITSVTRRLLEHWRDRTARALPFYFCQVEAIETLIWHVEAAAEYRQGIYIPATAALGSERSDPLDRGPRPDPRHPPHPALLRPVGDALRPDGQGEHGGRAVLLGRVRFRAQRCDRGGPRQDAKGRHPRRCVAGCQDLPVEALPHLPRPIGCRGLQPAGRTARSLAQARPGRLHPARRRLSGTATTSWSN